MLAHLAHVWSTHAKYCLMLQFNRCDLKQAHESRKYPQTPSPPCRRHSCGLIKKARLGPPPELHSSCCVFKHLRRSFLIIVFTLTLVFVKSDCTLVIPPQGCSSSCRAPTALLTWTCAPSPSTSRRKRYDTHSSSTEIQINNHFHAFINFLPFSFPGTLSGFDQRLRDSERGRRGVLPGPECYSGCG